MAQETSRNAVRWPCCGAGGGDEGGEEGGGTINKLVVLVPLVSVGLVVESRVLLLFVAEGLVLLLIVAEDVPSV